MPVNGEGNDVPKQHFHLYQQLSSNWSSRGWRMHTCLYILHSSVHTCIHGTTILCDNQYRCDSVQWVCVVDSQGLAKSLFSPYSTMPSTSCLQIYMHIYGLSIKHGEGLRSRVIAWNVDRYTCVHVHTVHHWEEYCISGNFFHKEFNSGVFFRWDVHTYIKRIEARPNLPELVRIELVAELLEREAAMLMALDRREAGMVDCPARDWTVAAPTCTYTCTC